MGTLLFFLKKIQKNFQKFFQKKISFFYFFLEIVLIQQKKNFFFPQKNLYPRVDNIYDFYRHGITCVIVHGHIINIYIYVCVCIHVSSGLKGTR